MASSGPAPLRRRIVEGAIFRVHFHSKSETNVSYRLVVHKHTGYVPSQSKRRSHGVVPITTSLPSQEVNHYNFL